MDYQRAGLQLTHRKNMPGETTSTSRTTPKTTSTDHEPLGCITRPNYPARKAIVPLNPSAPSRSTQDARQDSQRRVKSRPIFPLVANPISTSSDAAQKQKVPGAVSSYPCRPPVVKASASSCLPGHPPHPANCRRIPIFLPWEAWSLRRMRSRSYQSPRPMCQRAASLCPCLPDFSQSPRFLDSPR